MLVQCIVLCIVCYGEYGEGMLDSGFFLCLVGKFVDYLVCQLCYFQQGLCKYGLMEYIVCLLSDVYMYEIVEYFVVQQVFYICLFVLKVFDVLFVCGEVLIVYGDLEWKIFVCVVCYGSQFIGVQFLMFGLVGLFYDYVSLQFGFWCIGMCVVVVFDCMVMIVNWFMLVDIIVVFVWLVSCELLVDMYVQLVGLVQLFLQCGVLDVMVVMMCVGDGV